MLTGSSIMPQKKNPDPAELIRGRAGKNFGSLHAMLTIMKGLPLSYYKDMQEDKVIVFNSFDTLLESIIITNELIKSIKANKERMLNLSNEGLIDLPSTLKECKKLKKLTLNNNRITFLPFWFKELDNLEELDISGNRKLNINQAFSIISQLPKLQKITANHCNMFYLPVAIRRIKTLKEVNISDNHIKNLPPIFEYTHWEKLDLSYNCCLLYTSPSPRDRG